MLPIRMSQAPSLAGFVGRNDPLRIYPPARQALIEATLQPKSLAAAVIVIPD